MKFQTHWNLVEFTIQFLVKEMCNISIQGRKRNAIMNFQIVNAKNLTGLLMFSPEFNVERELCNTSVLSSHFWIKT